MIDATDPLAPSDNTTLSAVIAGCEQDGFTEQFVLEDDGVARCTVCGCPSPPAHLAASSLRRLEGASEPADMSAVLAIRCPGCGAKGTLVVMLGPDAPESDVALLQSIQDVRSPEADLPMSGPSSDVEEQRVQPG
jgi:hypothetical protein